MIIWLSSYPKNGNTWLRSLISAYYFTKDGFFLGDQQLKYISQFPVKRYFESFKYDPEKPGDTVRLWIEAQEKINLDKKVRFFKTHNALVRIGQNDFTNQKNSLGGIYIVRDPRDVLVSFAHHFGLGYEETFIQLTSSNSYEYPISGGKNYKKTLINNYDSQLNSNDHFNNELYDTLHNKSLPIILKNIDRASMANSVEMRLPVRFISFWFRITASSLKSNLPSSIM